MNKLIVAVLLATTLGCAVHATVDARLGKEPGPSANMKTVETLVCRGDIVGAEGFLNARGYDTAGIIEAIENAKLKCAN